MLELTCRRLRWLSYWAFLFLLVGGTAGGAQARTYIPKDLYDCYVNLERILEPEVISEIQSSTTAEAITRYYPTVGTMIKDQWELTKKSRLTNYFKKLGVRNPDDIASMILRGFWHHLHDTPFNVSQIIATKLSSNR